MVTSLFQRGLTYCRHVSLRMTQVLTSTNQPKINNVEHTCTISTTPRLLQDFGHPYKFKTPSPYKNPGPRRHGYRQGIYDGGPLPRGDFKPYKNRAYHPTDSWSKKKALFGQNDYIDILGDGTLHPVDLIQAPAWIKGFNGNELQRLSRRMKFEGTKIKQLYPLHHHNMWKRIRYMYKKYNHYRGKRH